MSNEGNIEICLEPILTEEVEENHKKVQTSFEESSPIFEICQDKVLGRYLAATKEIKESDVILKESPIIWGPAQNTVPVCLGCGTMITENNCTPCSKCGWPLCSEQCEDAPGHIPECYYTVQRGNKISINSFEIEHPSYQCITVLRCLYQKEFDQEVWKKLEVLESHCKERQKIEKYEIDRQYIAKFIRNFFHLKGSFDEEEILRVTGIITINGHEVPLTSPPHVAIYEITSMLEHSCRANCYKTFTDEGEVLIVAGQKIQEGEHLTICYTDSLWGTLNRRHHLSESKFFWCSCKRCADPTEFGTYFSSLKCQNGECKGCVLPDTFLDEELSKWTCNCCGTERTNKSIQNTLERIGKDLNAMEKNNSGSCKMFLDYYGKILPQTHFYLTDVKLALLQIIGQEGEQGLTAVSNNDLEEKAKLSQEVCNLMKIMVPAEKRLRGILLFELHAALAEIGRRKGTCIDAGPEEFYSTLLKSRTILSEVIEMLKYEPTSLQEGKIYRQAKINLENMDLILRNVHNAIGDSSI